MQQGKVVLCEMESIAKHGPLEPGRSSLKLDRSWTGPQEEAVLYRHRLQLLTSTRDTVERWKEYSGDLLLRLRGALIPQTDSLWHRGETRPESCCGGSEPHVEVGDSTSGLRKTGGCSSYKGSHSSASGKSTPETGGGSGR